MLPSCVLVLVMVAAGTGLTSWMSPHLRFEERVAVGAVTGATACSAVAFGAFELWGMGGPSLAVALAVPAAVGLGGIVRHRARWSRELSSAWRRLRMPSAHAASLRPLAVVTVAAGAVTTRILSLAYQTTPQGRSAGSLATWSDWAAHLAYAGSFAYGDNRGLDQPIASGHGFRYHFLADFFGALFTVSGATLEQSLVLSAWVLAIAIPPLVWCAVERLTGSRATAGLTLVLFVLSGGLGAWYFLRDVENEGWDIVTSLPQTYARIPDQHIWVDNTISASFFAQRSTLMGWAIGLAALVLVLASRPRWSRAGFAAGGVLVGVTGIAHVHMLATALVLGLLALAADRSRTWWWFLVPAAVIGAPLAFAIRPQSSSMRWMVGWMAVDAGQSWPWFWLRNVGLLLPVFAGISLFGGVARRLRRLTAPLWLWFFVPNVVAFHPSEWNNTKFFLFWQFAGCLVVAAWLVRVASTSASWREPVRRYAAQTAVVVTVFVMVSAGGLDTARAMQRSTAIPWVDEDDVAAATWLREHSRADDVIVYGTTNTSAVAALGGRRALSGYPGWTYDLGIEDWGERWSASVAILQGAPVADADVRRYGVDFVVIGPRERREASASDTYWERSGTLVFEQGEYRIYAVG